MTLLVPFFTIHRILFLDIPRGPPKQGTDFGLDFDIDGEMFGINFAWNGHHQCYAMTVSRSDRRMWRTHPVAGHNYVFRNMLRNNRVTPDVAIRLQDLRIPVEDEGKNIGTYPKPDDFGENFVLVFQVGEVA